VDEEQRVNVRDVLRHTVATLAYRGGKVLRGAPPGFGSFRVGGTSRTPAEILSHLCDLLDWSLSLVRGREAWRVFDALGALDGRLAVDGPIGCPWTRLFQGPIADAFTHVGQLAFLRRLAGSAVRGENYFRAEIFPGHVGPEQAPPRREFD
jgi:hypothetical protein